MAALGAGALVVLVFLATSVVSPGRSPVRSSVKAVAARAALGRWLRQGLLRPGVRAPHHQAHRIGALNQVDFYNWSGYADDDSSSTTYTKVSGYWVEPAVACPADEDEVAVFWVGLDGFSSPTVEQDGTLAQCYEGTAYYYSWWEMYPTYDIVTVGSTVAAGDHIAASVNYASGKYSLKLTDSTTSGNSFTESKACGSGETCENSSAEWIAETPEYARGFSPLPSYGTWNVSSAKVTGSGTAGAISSFSDDQINLVGVFGENLATAGSLSGAGSAFADAWHYTW